MREYKKLGGKEFDYYEIDALKDFLGEFKSGSGIEIHIEDDEGKNFTISIMESKLLSPKEVLIKEREKQLFILKQINDNLDKLG